MKERAGGGRIAGASPPARALPAIESESYDRWSRLVQRQFGAVLRMTLGVVVGIELFGNRSQVSVLGHWLAGRPVPLTWDLCAGWAQSDVLIAMVAIAIAIPTLAATIAQRHVWWASVGPGIARSRSIGWRPSG